MWNAPLANGIPLTVATGCALVLFGVSLGLVIAAVCWVCIAVPTDQQAAAPQGSDATISDDEIEIVIELVHDALAGGGWTLCGDCYTRNLLQRLRLPLQGNTSAEWEQPAREPASTLRVEHGASLGRVPTPTY